MRMNLISDLERIQNLWLSHWEHPSVKINLLKTFQESTRKRTARKENAQNGKVENAFVALNRLI
jgi:hypothetical protein